MHKLNSFLSDLPTHQAIIAAGIALAFLTLAYVGGASIHHNVNEGLLTVILTFIGTMIAGGGAVGIFKRTSDIDYQLAKKGIISNGNGSTTPPTTTAEKP